MDTKINQIKYFKQQLATCQITRIFQTHVNGRGPRGSEAKYIAYPSQKPASSSSSGPRYYKQGSAERAWVV
jgi:hypothetical protein